MIDEKRLEYLHGGIQSGICVEPYEADELIRIARLGIWAEKYGVPELSLAVEIHPLGVMTQADLLNRFQKALAALPKDSQ
jgi:hypothetical protein